MYGAVVELYALTDTNWTGTKYDNGFFTEWFNFVFLCISTVVVRCFRFEFCSTCIYIFICWKDIPFFTFRTNLFYCCISITGDNRISEGITFCFAQYIFCQAMFSQCFFYINNVFDFFNKECINFCNIVNFFYTNALAKCFCYNIDTFIIY